MLIRFADLLFLARPTLFFVNWIVLILGHTRGSGPARPGGLALLMVQYACISGAAVVVNQLRDRHTDRENGKLPTLERGLVSPRAATVFAALLLLAGIGVAVPLGWLQGLLSLVFFLLAGLVYNLPPLATKDRPWAGMATLAPATSLLYLQAALAAGATGWRDPLLQSLPIVSACLGVGLVTTLPDLAGDRASGKRTFPVCYGPGPTWLLAQAFMALALALALWLDQTVVAVPALLALGLLVWGRTRGNGAAGPVARWSILAMALALVPGQPWFGVLMVVFFALARVYYKQRLGLTYPRLGWDN